MKKALFSANVYRHLADFHTPYMQLLQQKGYEVYAIANEDYGGFKDKLTALGVKCIDVPISRNPLSFDNYRAFRVLRTVLKDGEFDIVHVHTPVAAFLTRLANVNVPTEKLIYSVHGFHFFKGAPLKNWLLYLPLELINVRNTDELVTTNLEDTAFARKMGFAADHVTHIKGVGVELQIDPMTEEEKRELRASLGLSDQQTVVTCVAEANDNKNQMFLLKNWTSIKQQAPDAALLFAGKGPNLEAYQQYAADQQLKDVHFLGFRSDVSRLLQITDILTLLSQREGLPKSIMEGMANGLPCIVSDTRGLMDLVEDDVNGLVITKGDDKMLVQRFVRLLNDAELRQRYGHASQEKVQDFSIQSVIKDYARLYGVND